MATETKNDKPILARVGNALDDKTGAEVKTAKTRMNGQTIGESHRAICASLKDIT